MKSKIILFIILIIILGILTYFAYPLLKSRYFSIQKKSIISSQNSDVNNLPNQVEKTSQEESISETTFKSESLQVSVSPPDCDNECANFKENTQLKYCQEICGLHAKEEVNEDCQAKTGLEKDYCLKDLAIKNKDFKTCDQIKDSGIKKTCKNRITEDILDSQKKL